MWFDSSPGSVHLSGVALGSGVSFQGFTWSPGFALVWPKVGANITQLAMYPGELDFHVPQNHRFCGRKIGVAGDSLRIGMIKLIPRAGCLPVGAAGRTLCWVRLVRFVRFAGLCSQVRPARRRGSKFPAQGPRAFLQNHSWFTPPLPFAPGYYFVRHRSWLTRGRGGLRHAESLVAYARLLADAGVRAS